MKIRLRGHMVEHEEPSPSGEIYTIEVELTPALLADLEKTIAEAKAETHKLTVAFVKPAEPYITPTVVAVHGSWQDPTNYKLSNELARADFEFTNGKVWFADFRAQELARFLRTKVWVTHGGEKTTLLEAAERLAGPEKK